MGLNPTSTCRTFALAIACIVFLRPALTRADDVKTYESKYYTVISDFPPDQIKELLLRLDQLVPAYNQNFPALRGVISAKYKLLLCKNRENFAANGAPAGNYAVGYMNIGQLLFILRPDLEQAIHDIQYHGYTQFCDQSIGTISHTMPPWLLMGLSKYYRYSEFTGDGYVCGLLPDVTLIFMQNSMKQGKFGSCTALMERSREDLFQKITDLESHQAWSLILFLDKGDNAKHHAAFAKYLHDVARGISHKEAWKKAFGDMDIDALWKQWLMSQTQDMVHELYAQATVQTLCAYLGRAQLAGQQFTRAADLITAVKTNSVKMNDADWLPASLSMYLQIWIPPSGADTKFEIGPDAKKPQVIATLKNNVRIVANFDAAQKDHRTIVDIDAPGRPKPAPINPDEGGKNTIAIKSAKFGAGQTWVDVTEKCQSMVAGDLLLAPNGLVSSLGMDPAGGVNYLDFHLVVNGAAVHITIADSRELVPLRLTTQLPAAQE